MAVESPAPLEGKYLVWITNRHAGGRGERITEASGSQRTRRLRKSEERREGKMKENPSEDFSTKGREDWCLNSSFMWGELELAGTRVSRDRWAPRAHLWASAPFPHSFYPKEKCDLEMAREGGHTDKRA